MFKLEIDYEERVKLEYIYIDFVNAIRQISKKIMTNVNPDTNMRQFYQLMEELRDTLFTEDEFGRRFLNEELKSDLIY